MLYLCVRETDTNIGTALCVCGREMEGEREREIEKARKRDKAS